MNYTVHVSLHGVAYRYVIEVAIQTNVLLADDSKFQPRSARSPYYNIDNNLRDAFLLVSMRICGDWGIKSGPIFNITNSCVGRGS